MLSLESLNTRFSKEKKPSNIDFIYFLFFEKGIGMEKFNNYPIPYIVKIVSVSNYVNKKEQESMKKK